MFSVARTKATRRFAPAALLFVLGTVQHAHADDGLSAIRGEAQAAPAAIWLPIVGIKGSAGFTHFLASPEDRAADVDMQRAPGGGIGVFAMIRRHAYRYLSIGMQTELLYSARQGHMRYGSGQELRFALRYVELPVLGHVEVTAFSRWSPFAMIGVSPGLLQSAHMEPGAEYGVDARDLVRGYDLGWAAALGTRYALPGGWQLTMEARYQRGAVSMFQYTDRHSSALSVSIGIGYDRSFQVGGAGGASRAFVAEEPKSTQAEMENLDEAEAESVARDRRRALLASADCFLQDPTFFVRTQSQPGDTEVLRFAYTRTTQGDMVTLRDIRLLGAPSHSRQLATCVQRALQALSWWEPGTLPEGKTRHELRFPLDLVQAVARQ